MYPGVYGFISMRLQDSAAGLPNATFDPEITICLLKMLSPYGETYAGLTGNDIAFANNAAGLLVAARLLTPLSTGGLNADVASEKTETTSRTLAGGSAKDLWVKEAKESIAFLSFVIAQRPVPVFMGVNGPRRAWELAHPCPVIPDGGWITGFVDWGDDPWCE